MAKVPLLEQILEFAWCSVRNSLRDLCLYLLSMTYDPPLVIPLLHMVRKLFIYEGRDC